MADVKQIELNGVILDVKDATARNDIATLNGVVAGKVPDTRTINSNPLSADIVLTSSDIGYDNTVSGLTATNVKAAIDELSPSAALGKEVSNGDLKNNTTYLLLITEGSNSHRLQVVYRTVSSSQRVSATDITSNGITRFMVWEITFASGTITLSGNRTAIAADGTINPGAAWTNFTLNKIYQLSP